MILLRLSSRPAQARAYSARVATDVASRVLNVGGGSKDIPIPSHYANWRHDLLDIDPKGQA